MILVLILGCGLGWLGRLKQAETAYQQARFARQVAELTIVEYAQWKRAEDRVAWSNRMYAKGYVSKAQNTADKVNLKQKVFAWEQAWTKKAVLAKYTRVKTIKELESEVEKAKSDELAKKAAYDRLKTPWIMLSW
jgi:hypothetical protein